MIITRNTVITVNENQSMTTGVNIDMFTIRWCLFAGGHEASIPVRGGPNPREEPRAKGPYWLSLPRCLAAGFCSDSPSCRTDHDNKEQTVSDSWIH